MEFATVPFSCVAINENFHLVLEAPLIIRSSLCHGGSIIIERELFLLLSLDVYNFLLLFLLIQ